MIMIFAIKIFAIKFYVNRGFPTKNSYIFFIDNSV